MWMLQIVGFLGIGLAVVLAAVVGLPYVIAKSLGHDQATCDCWDCQGRRQRAVDKAVSRRDKKTGYHPQPEEDTPLNQRSSTDYWTTIELRTGYHVIVKKTMYEVGAIRTMVDGNCMVHLRNIRTRQDVRPIMVTHKLKAARLWRKGFDSRLYR